MANEENDYLLKGKALERHFDLNKALFEFHKLFTYVRGLRGLKGDDKKVKQKMNGHERFNKKRPPDCIFLIFIFPEF